MLTREEAIKILQQFIFNHAHLMIGLEPVNRVLEFLKQLPEQPRRMPIHTAISTYENQYGGIMTVVVTTCNDGTRWKEDAGSGFMKMPPIPQDDEVKG